MQNEQSTERKYDAPLLKEQIDTSDINSTPDNPPWNALSAIGVWLASVFFIAVFPFLFLIPYVALQNVDLSDQTKMLEFFKSDSTAIILQLAAVLPAHLFTLILAWAVITQLNRLSFKQTLGWSWGGFKVWHLIILSFICYAVGIILISLFGHRETEFQQILKSSRTAVYIVAFFATFTAPLVEEVVYRGVLYSAFQRHFGRIVGVVIVTILFAVVHVPQYYPDFGTILTILFVSLILTLIRVRAGNLFPCIVLHTIFNGVQSVLLVSEPYLKNLADQ
ncbi:MAG TPA: type II CAAX endopeptidase family protein, partial [Pyrinomonadaceae bacterium]